MTVVRYFSRCHPQSQIFGAGVEVCVHWNGRQNVINGQSEKSEGRLGGTERESISLKTPWLMMILRSSTRDPRRSHVGNVSYPPEPCPSILTYVCPFSLSWRGAIGVFPSLHLASVVAPVWTVVPNLVLPPRCCLSVIVATVHLSSLRLCEELWCDERPDLWHGVSRFCFLVERLSITATSPLAETTSRTKNVDHRAKQFYTISAKTSPCQCRFSFHTVSK